jgi:dihydrofolate reductase
LKQVIRGIKGDKGKDMQIVGGGSFAASCINTGLVDEYRLMFNPVILGRGQLLYSNLLSQHSLELIIAEPMDNGVVILAYRPLQKE